MINSYIPSAGYNLHREMQNNTRTFFLYATSDNEPRALLMGSLVNNTDKTKISTYQIFITSSFYYQEDQVEAIRFVLALLVSQKSQVVTIARPFSPDAPASNALDDLIYDLTKSSIATDAHYTFKLDTKIPNGNDPSKSTSMTFNSLKSINEYVQANDPDAVLTITYAP